MGSSQGAPLLGSQGQDRVEDTDEVALLSHLRTFLTEPSKHRWRLRSHIILGPLLILLSSLLAAPSLQFLEAELFEGCNRHNVVCTKNER